MKKQFYKWSIVGLLLTCLTTGAFSQQTKKTSRDHYLLARTSFKLQNYADALNQLYTAEKEGNGSNVYIEIMKAKCHLATNKWQKAEEAINRCYRYSITEWVEEELLLLSMAIDDHFNLALDTNTSNVNNIDSINKAQENLLLEKILAYTPHMVEFSNKTIGKEQTLQQYLNNYPEGRYAKNVRQYIVNQEDENKWQKAIEINNSAAFIDYLDNFPSGIYSSKAKSTVNRWDKEAFEKAIAENTKESLNYYLDNYSKGKYRKTIKENLKTLIEFDVYLSAKDNKSGLCKPYDYYISQYPRGKYAQEVHKWRKDCHLAQGNQAYREKDWKSAESNYGVYKSNYPKGADFEFANKRWVKSGRRIKQKSAGFLLYTYETESPLGFAFGKVNPNAMGYYINVRMNSDIIKQYDVLWKIDNEGSSTSPFDIEPTGEIRKANISLTGGLTFKLAYPLFGYVGGGVGWNTHYLQVDEYDNGEFHETVWIRNTDETTTDYYPEAGILLKAGNALMLKYGVAHRNTIYHQFGIGFQF